MGASGTNEKQNKKKILSNDQMKSSNIDRKNLSNKFIKMKTNNDKNERIEEGIIPGSKKIEILENSKLKYMEKYICKINGEKIGTGFFCKIKYKKELIPVLMTNYHVIDDDFLKNNKFIKIYIKGDYHLININKNSKIYSSTNDKYDIMIINLNEDNNDFKYLLQIDTNIFLNNSLLTYKNEPIYILYYPNTDKACISYGKGI